MSASENINKIELHFLSQKDYSQLQAVMKLAYPSMPESIWDEKHIKKLIRIFPEGQVVIKIDGKIAGAALSIIVDYASLGDQHTYVDATGHYTFDTHTSKGDMLYGIDVFISPEFRGLRLGRRLYDYRKDLCEKKVLKGIVFGGRMPNYGKYANQISPRQYIDKVREREIHDPVLNFQLSNDFHVRKIIKNYLVGDTDSMEFAALMKWDNIYYEDPVKRAASNKTVVRLGLVQWQMRTYKSFEDMLEQIEFFVDAVAAYRCDFALFPELFNAPLMAPFNSMSTPEAIRELAKFTDRLRDFFQSLAISYNINIITGSMPQLTEDGLFNVGFVCRRDGTNEKYVKIHVTPDEEKVWGMKGGNQIKTINTDCGKIGVLICYDAEFPELSRILAKDGVNILFVPFLTDTQNGYSRVRYCARARAIENECYVAIAGSVGNLPRVQNMDIQYAQSAVFTPCDFQFPFNGIKAEATPNTEMILVADVDIDLLKELNKFGSVRNLKDRRTDVYDVILVK
jgi:predicted amidohydrolase